jgi:beta-glucosidase
VFSAPGADPHNSDLAGIPAAVKLAKSADVTVLVIGEDFDLSGESRSRSDLELPASQLELARRVLGTGKPVIVVLANGRPLALPWLAENAPAILESWMRPADPDLKKDTVRYHDLSITPQFAFGHGLSYSEFRYSDLSQSTQTVGPGGRIDISVTVENTGGVASDEVVQLYVRDPQASIARPVLELRGFKRLDLGVGARKRITFSLTPEQLAFWGPRGQWLIEAGRIDFWIGASSADLRANGSFEITKTHTGSEPAAALPTRVIVSGIN